MPKAKLTKRAVEAVAPGAKDIILWDTDLKGFGCKVTPKSRRVYFVYYRTRDGRQRRPTIGAHGAITCEQAREIARQWLGDAAAGADPSGQRQAKKGVPTVAEFAERYLAEHAEPHKRPSSIANDRRMLAQHILPALGRRKLSEVTRADVLKLHHALRHTPYEANRTLAVLSKLFNLAEAWGLRPDGSNPCRHVKRYTEKNRERFLSPAELACLGGVIAEAERTQTESPSVIAAIRLLIFTGARLSEILTLRWEHVDLDNACLQLPDSKTGRKVIYLSPPAKKVLAGIERKNGNANVIIGQKPEAHLVNLEKPWRRIRKRAKLDDVRLHDLRHSYASVGAALNMGLPVIGALLGHTQAATTQRYAHLQGDPLRAASDRIGEAIAATMNGKSGEVVELPGHKR